MPRNGSGSYSLPAGNPFVPNTVISSTTMNNTMNDLGTALTQSIANDGQTTPVANLPMATFRHTNVGNAVARTDYAAAGQVQDSSLQWLTSVSGADTITAALTPSPGAYVAGQTFRFVAAGANTTTAVTLNINGLGAKNITKNGTIPLVVGDIPSGGVVVVVYDGTQFQLVSVGASGLGIVGTSRNVKMNITAASASGTLTANEIIVETALGGTAYRLPSFNKTINLATTGAGGMDTGAAPVSGYVAVYAIYNPSTGASALLATNATSSAQPEVYGGANMPSGYTASALLSVWPTTAASQFQTGLLNGRRLSVPQTAFINTTTVPAGFTLVTTTAFPPNAVRIGGQMQATSTAVSAVSFSLTPTSNGNGLMIISDILSQIGTSLTSNFVCDIAVSQNVYYRGTSTAGTTTLFAGMTFYDI